MKPINKIKIIAVLCISMLFALEHVSAQQQIENSMSQYFRNRMLWNAAFTGIDGNKLYAIQNRSWVGFEGAPITTNFSGELNFGQNSAGGLQISTDISGILYKTYGVLNYAYRIKFSQEQQLRIGLSFILSGERLNTRYIDQGGSVDPLIANSINQKVQYDGNIAGVYTNKKFTLGVSFYRLSDNLSTKSGGSADLAFAQLGASYDININGDEKVNLKPLAMLRLYRTTSSVADFGAQFEYNKLVNIMLVYQTTGNIRAGAGVQLKDLGEANFFYNTNNKVASGYSQQYELGIGFYLKGKKQ